MSRSRRRARHQAHEEEHDNHERWLVTYADMLTLLMVLFIVMFAMSQVDEHKYNALRSGLAEGFGADSSITKGSNSVLEEAPPAGPEVVPSKVFQDMSTAEQQLVRAAVDAEAKRHDSGKRAAAEAEAERLEQMREKLMRALAKAGLAQDVRTTIDERGLVVSLVSRHVVFQPDVAQLSPRGERVVDVLAKVLRTVPNDLRIDGHTNQEPVKPRLYATDWDLSAARAVTVLRRLNERDGVPKKRLSAAAFGHERPLIDPSKPGAQEVNKRVDIVVLPQTGAAASQLIDDVLHARPGGEGEKG